jgi:uncharacterized iron-regulated membrane protein
MCETISEIVTIEGKPTVSYQTVTHTVVESETETILSTKVLPATTVVKTETQTEQQEQVETVVQTEQQTQIETVVQTEMQTQVETVAVTAEETEVETAAPQETTPQTGVATVSVSSGPKFRPAIVSLAIAMAAVLLF